MITVNEIVTYFRALKIQSETMIKVSGKYDTGVKLTEKDVVCESQYAQLNQMS